jgi:hypothetical protein
VNSTYQYHPQSWGGIAFQTAYGFVTNSKFNVQYDNMFIGKNDVLIISNRHWAVVPYIFPTKNNTYKTQKISNRKLRHPALAVASWEFQSSTCAPLEGYKVPMEPGKPGW